MRQSGGGKRTRNWRPSVETSVAGKTNRLSCVAWEVARACLTIHFECDWTRRWGAVRCGWSCWRPLPTTRTSSQWVTGTAVFVLLIVVLFFSLKSDWCALCLRQHIHENRTIIRLFDWANKQARHEPYHQKCSTVTESWASGKFRLAHPHPQTQLSCRWLNCRVTVHVVFQG